MATGFFGLRGGGGEPSKPNLAFVDEDRLNRSGRTVSSAGRARDRAGGHGTLMKLPAGAALEHGCHHLWEGYRQRSS
jgi:hypothetical protein